MFTSVLNDVLGPIMRGPSSSHTAGSYHIGLIVRQLLGTEPQEALIRFDDRGSYGNTYRQQGVDQAFTTGLMGWKQTDEIFIRAISAAEELGVRFVFEVSRLASADHPNYVLIDVKDQQGRQLKVEAKSVGGGTFRVTGIDDIDVLVDGKSFETLLTVPENERIECPQMGRQVSS